MKVGSLFSGIGGFDLGLERAGCEISWQIENNDYCRKILKKHWPKVPCHYDIKSIDWRDIPAVDLVCGGFPCQPFSVAGKRAGAADDRYLWAEVVRCLDALRPTWFLGENVPGIINMALDQVCADLEGLGYEVWPVCIPACAVDAPHRRDRLWIVAHHEGQLNRQYHGGKNAGQIQQSRIGLIEADVADASRELLNGSRTTRTRRGRQSTNESWWPAESSFCRVAHGIPARVDRLKGLGNAIIPEIAEAFGWMIREVEA